MEKIVFSPSLINRGRVLVVIALVIATVILGSILPKAFLLSTEVSDNPIVQQIIISTLFAIFLIWSIFTIMTYIQISNRKIEIDSNFLYFYNKSLLGSWQLKTINLKDVGRTEDRKDRFFIFSNGVIIPVYFYWLKFIYKDSKQEEVSVKGWDREALQKIIYCIKDKFPNIKFYTHVYKDSLEKITGIDDFLSNNIAS